jgi:chromosome segregation and condensation protein ScpB
MDEALAALLALVAAEEGLSTARACKRLGLSRSQLQRHLTRLGPDTRLGGLDLVRVADEGDRETLWLVRR